MQTNAFYRGVSDEVQGRQDGILSITSKDSFKEKGTVAFNVNDLLNSRKRSSFTTTDFFEQNSVFQRRERSFNLSFTYRFNQKKKREGSGRDRNGEDDFDEK